MKTIKTIALLVALAGSLTATALSCCNEPAQARSARLCKCIDTTPDLNRTPYLYHCICPTMTCLVSMKAMSCQDTRPAKPEAQ